MPRATTVTLPGIKAERDLVERLSTTAQELAISKSEAIRRALTMFLDSPLEQQQRDTDIESMVRRIVDERLALRDNSGGNAAA